jgi:hypothetical protein
LGLLETHLSIWNEHLITPPTDENHGPSPSSSQVSTLYHAFMINSHTGMSHSPRMDTGAEFDNEIVQCSSVIPANWRRYDKACLHFMVFALFMAGVTSSSELMQYRYRAKRCCRAALVG